MATQIYVNLPVKNLDASKTFFAKLGFTFNPQFSDANAACLILGANMYAMLLREPFFQSFSKKELVDTKTHSQVMIALDAESREKVDELVRKAVEAGGSLYSEPMDQGWMYGHGFADLDGHQWEVVYMDMSRLPQA